jgi:AbrB family looped-hinge helix DNA binding protein
MENTKLSTKGQIVLPKAIRISRSWGPGTEFSVIETNDGILLRPAARFPKTTLDEVAGCLRYQGKPATIEQMDAAIMREMKRRDGSGRY